MSRERKYWKNTYEYQRILEILDDYWLTEKDESEVDIEMYFRKGEEEQWKHIDWRNPNQ